MDFKQINCVRFHWQYPITYLKEKFAFLWLCFSSVFSCSKIKLNISFKINVIYRFVSFSFRFLQNASRKKTKWIFPYCFYTVYSFFILFYHKNWLESYLCELYYSAFLCLLDKTVYFPPRYKCFHRVWMWNT